MADGQSIAKKREEFLQALLAAGSAGPRVLKKNAAKTTNAGPSPADCAAPAPLSPGEPAAAKTSPSPHADSFSSSKSAISEAADMNMSAAT
eukprot:CAMPEP_0174290838 /NCGR_PEP_ID=MMETSP0809-20121228/30322_1 /TAXON_ID=73025 ORGANISM="Eutreptiella gymnastica-like, Strain CCMP1594" /NCGR_SAMPLE_ID=MMETSP0809 /ASSEMBLY_ACC=CAM_ASM_000658 /LENGTH=90 /DNA_ID=CAMNT_0015389817 /DNA_START=55 /DNA_END=323 /DNA_ORIENTATION=+